LVRLGEIGEKVSSLPVVEQNWKQADTEALQERVNAIDHWLAHTENILEMLHGDEAISVDLRAISGMLKSRKGDFEAEIKKLTF
jgi:hypothetical protein